MSIFSDSLLISFLLCDHHCGFLTSFIWQLTEIYLKYLLFFHVSLFLALFSSYRHFNQPYYLSLPPKKADFFSFLFVFLPLFILIPSFDILFLSDFFTNLMIISNLHVCLFITCISVYSLWHFFFWMNVFCTARISCKYYLETLFKSCNHLAVLF